MHPSSATNWEIMKKKHDWKLLGCVGSVYILEKFRTTTITTTTTTKGVNVYFC